MESSSDASRGSAFPPTQWSLVVAAGGDSTGAAGAALEQLCRVYWSPLYAFARRTGHSPEAAEDLTQSFFVELVESGLVGRADAERGRFRSFLLGTFKHFMTDDWRRSTTVRRGGGLSFVPLDRSSGEERYAATLAVTENPELAFDRHWAMSLLEEAMRLLETELQESGRGQIYQRLYRFIQGDEEKGGYSDAARDLETTESTIRVTVHRLRRRYRELLRFLVLQTMLDPLQVEEELRHLLDALRR